MLMKIHTSYDEYRIQRLKHQPHAVQNITLMSSICKLPKAIASSAVVGAICTAILSRFDSGCRCYHGHGGRHHHHHRAPQQHQQQSQHEHNSNQSTNCRHAHNQQTVPSHQRIVVKPNFLATNLVNTLMISLYITLFISIAVHPVVVNAVAPKYETAYACEEKMLTIGCDPGYVIQLIRANYGRFSITICNDQGNVDWSVNCMSVMSVRVLYSKCSQKQNCTVMASTNVFGDACPGTHKYLEAHYQCIPASQATSTTARPSPAWLITSQPSVWGTSTVRFPTTARIPLSDFDPLSTVVSIVNRNYNSYSNSNNNNNGTSSDNNSSNISGGNKSQHSDNENSNNNSSSNSSNINDNNNSNANDSMANRTKTVTKSKLSGAHMANATSNTLNNNRRNENASVAAVTKPMNFGPSSTSKTSNVNGNSNNNEPEDGVANERVSSMDYANQKPAGGAYDEANGLFCGPTTARNLFWNFTRVGDSNVQPCPGGATGIAKWRCSNTLLPTAQPKHRSHSSADGDNQLADAFEPNTSYMWQPSTPDLTQCRSLWLNSLEVRVSSRDSAVVSIANDLSQVTNSKTLYGGDMLVTTKIIQSLYERMMDDIETFSDQRQREAVVMELLNSVVKTASNLLDETQQHSWMDLSFEDQMRVATSLLTGLEDNAFLLADTIAAERNVVQKVKNILLSVRVLETRSIASNQIFPDASIESGEFIGDDSIELPRGALIENSEGGLVRIVFVAFERLESILRPLDSTNGEQKSFDDFNEAQGPSEYAPLVRDNGIVNASQQARERILNSKVISASLGKGRHIQLSQPIRLVLKHLLTDNVTNPTCVFWNYIDHAWSEDGCHIDQTNRTHTVCMCNHLTNFAILMDVIDDSAQFIQQIGVFDKNMRILITISIVVSIIFIIIVLLTLKFYNGIFMKSNRTTIYKNLYICLLVTEVLIWLGIVQNESSMLCGFTTAFLHCSFLCTISWIFLEGFQSYVVLTTEEILLDVESSARIISYYLITYGLSFTIVAISLGIDPSAYTIKADACVWMEQSYLFYTTFLMPCFVYILANFAYIVYSIVVLRKKHKTALKNKEHTRLANIRFHLHGSFIFEVVFVGCWLFAYFYMVNLHRLYDSIGTPSMRYDSDIQANIAFFGYGFVILNILQGAFIFCFHCLQNERIRLEYQKFVRDSWLPQCLHCETTGSDDQGPTASPTNNALSANVLLPASNASIKKKTPADVNDVTGTFLGSPAHQAHGQTSTLMRHHQSQRHNMVGTYTGTLREHRSGGPSKYMTNVGIHKYQPYNFQNAELIYPHAAPSQQFHQLDDHAKMMYYDRKMGNSSRTLKSQNSSSTQQMLASPMKHDYPYWTESAEQASYQMNKMARHPNDEQMNSIQKYPDGGEMLQSQNYPSYRKKVLQYQQSAMGNHTTSTSHSQGNLRGVNATEFNGGRDIMGNRQSWLATNQYKHQQNGECDGQQQYNTYGDEEPVYEEIQSRTTENCDVNVYDVDNIVNESGSIMNSPYPNASVSEHLVQKPFRNTNPNNVSTKLRDASSPQQQQQHLHSRSVQQEAKHQPHIGRNISAMLNENNTVVCYLEPLSNS